LKIFLLPLMATLVLSACSTEQAVQVCSVHDGDTLTTCDGLKVRLLGIDAPELAQRFGPPSRKTLKSLVQGQSVSLSCTGRSYDRRVCTVFKNGRNINEEMVSLGAAFDYPQYSHGAFRAAQSEAQAQRVGMWKTGNGGIRPWDYRHIPRRKHSHRTFRF
jgi:micrococcal nuclease